jgi:hypothetical protein
VVLLRQVVHIVSQSEAPKYRQFLRAARETQKTVYKSIAGRDATPRRARRVAAGASQPGLNGADVVEVHETGAYVHVDFAPETLTESGAHSLKGRACVAAIRALHTEGKLDDHLRPIGELGTRKPTSSGAHRPAPEQATSPRTPRPAPPRASKGWKADLDDFLRQQTPPGFVTTPEIRLHLRQSGGKFTKKELNQYLHKSNDLASQVVNGMREWSWKR